MSQKGFTLLEIILALSILGTLGIITINILSDQIATRQKLGEMNTDEHSLDAALNRITKDIQGAYLIDSKIAPSLNLNVRPIVPQFYFKSGNLVFFTTAFRSYLYGSNQSNQAAIRYSTVTSQNNSSKRQLIRVIDTDFVSNIENDDVGLSQILIDDLESFRLDFWNGNDFISEWDSRAGDSQGKLPKMIRVHLSAYSVTKSPEIKGNENKDRKFNVLDTIVYLNHSMGQKEAMTPSAGEYKWQ